MNKGDVILTEKVQKRAFVMDQLIATQMTNALADLTGSVIHRIRRRS
jgi:hypothetical protein